MLDLEVARTLHALARNPGSILPMLGKQLVRMAPLAAMVDSRLTARWPKARKKTIRMCGHGRMALCLDCVRRIPSNTLMLVV